MTESTAPYTAFNARWLRPEEVARSYVPMPQLLKLARRTSSILMGPRGCGKTTLLKMLTPAALQSWREANPSEPPLLDPSFHAVYIPADTRWSYELGSVVDSCGNLKLVERAQRAMVGVNILLELSKAVESRLLDTSQRTNVAEYLVRHLHLEGLAPTFSEIRLGLTGIELRLREALNLGEQQTVVVLENAPSVLQGNPLDGATLVCRVLEELAPSAQPPAWALCFDELEIAPEWLQRELLGALRSSEQRVLLKLTWSPVLPGELRGTAAHDEDFRIVRLWHSHARDAAKFCETLAGNVLRKRLGATVTPDSLLGPSILASDDDATGEASTAVVGAYDTGSEFHSAAIALAATDQTFARLLEENGIDPHNPLPPKGDIRDRFFRKVKPIVLIREAFWRPERRRSRKSPRLYCGKEVVFAMSDGNPRRLLGLLNDLADKAEMTGDGLRVPDREQATILNGASRRFDLLIRAVVSRRKRTQPTTMSLHALIERIGTYLNGALMAAEFPQSEPGSVTVDSNVHDNTRALLEQALEIGALIYVGASPEDVPHGIVGARFRLAFILAPTYKTLVRNGRSVNLSQVLEETADPRQLRMFEHGGTHENGQR